MDDAISQFEASINRENATKSQDVSKRVERTPRHLAPHQTYQTSLLADRSSNPIQYCTVIFNGIVRDFIKVS